jgi:diaminohydroxyphosphoribosylaminopyrimidine deaminase/5-amino-6-(5-phosphoribosylamino)uracil reductase
MQRCLEISSKGLSSVMPNPSVGAVLVYEDKIIGEGYTSPYGGNHGEVNCMNSVKEHNRPYISKSTLYVSLEPCSHFGKTPPCANLIITHNIRKVVIGCIDTFSEVAGKGIEVLKQNNVEVVIGVLENECRELNKRFFTFHEKKRPFVLLKWAQTKDGFIAPEDELHEQERWITGDKTNQYVHQLRATEKAILVGKNTVQKDNPSLTVRHVDGTNPIRLVIDKKLELWKGKEGFKIFSTESKTLVFNSLQNFEENGIEGIKISFNNNVVKQILDILYEKGIQSLIVEGGSFTINSFLESNLWDEALVLEGNKTFGRGVEAPLFNHKHTKEFVLGKDNIKQFKNISL